ncbi:2493_t:CDS:2, partial [Dentiscutata heterogama]
MNNSRSYENNLDTNSDKSIHNNKDYLDLDNFDDESVYDLTQDNENSDLIQGASLDTGKNYNEVDLFYENKT